MLAVLSGKLLANHKSFLLLKKDRKHEGKCIPLTVYFRELKADSMDTHNSLWKLILIYLEGTQEVFDASQSLQLSEHKLVCKFIFFTLKVPNKNCSRRHFNFLLISFKENKA